VTVGWVGESWSTPERRALRESAAGFVRRHVVPHLAGWEEAGEIPRSVHREAAAAGLLGIGFPEEVGGQRGELVDVVTSMEAMVEAGASRPPGCSRPCSPTPSPFRTSSPRATAT
jgi:acyl-CoA dehydrogenase